MPFHVGMIGLGVISHYYLAALDHLPQLRLVGVCDLREAKLLPHRHANRLSCTDYRDLLTCDDIDAVIVNVPNDQHFEICQAALLAGKHVCCEKPLTNSLEDAQRLVALARQHGKTLFTAFHRRYNIHVQQAIPQIPSPDVITGVTAHYLERIEDHAGDDQWYLRPERCGGGCVADNGPNVYDTLSYCFGHLEVRSAWIDYDSHGVDRRASINLTTSHSIPVQAELDWSYIKGEKKDIIVEIRGGPPIVIDMLAGFPAFKSSLYHEYEAILEDFARCVVSGGCYGQEGLDAVRLVRETYVRASEGVTTT